jgi:chitinase
MWLIPSSVSVGAVAITLLLAQQSTAINGTATTLLLAQQSATIIANATAINDGSDKLNAYLAAHPVSTKTAVPTAISNNTLSPELVSLVLSQCPASCDQSGPNPGNWTLYPSLSRLSMCNETMLLDFTLFNSLRTDPTVRACTATFTSGAGNAGNGTNDGSCLPSGQLTQAQESLQLAFNTTSTQASVQDFEAASQQLAAALAQRDSNCTDVTSFTYANSVAVGLFAGSGVRGVPASVLQQFITKIQSTGFSKSAVVQLCAKDGRSSKYSFGIAASADKDISFVQDAVATWASGNCINSYDSAESWQNITLSLPSLLSNGTVGNSTLNNSTLHLRSLTSQSLNNLHRRTLCTTIQVVSGDSCKYSENSHQNGTSR